MTTMHTVLMARNLIFDCPYLPQGIMNLKATLLLKKICFLRVVAHLKQGSFAFEVWLHTLLILIL